MSDFGVTVRDAYIAKQRIQSNVRRTPLIHSLWLTQTADTSVFLKAENLQQTRSFKIRGAINKLTSLTEEERERGVIVVSSGNHGRAVAYVAKQLGMKAVICLSERAPRNKVESIKYLTAEVVVHGECYNEAEQYSHYLEKKRGLTYITSDDPFIIAGHATIGIELLEDLPEIDAVLVPVSAGGLIGGIGQVLKSVDPKVRMIGVSMKREPVMYRSLKAGKIVQNVEEKETLADALAGGIDPNNKYTFRMCQKYIDEFILVSEEEIAEAMAFALEKHHLVVEGAGAVGIAALMSRKVGKLRGNVAIVVTGGNVDLPLLLEITKERCKEKDIV